MGFNISVCARGAEYNQELNVFIPRTYYWFVSSYIRFGDDSVLIKLGKFLQLDLSALAKIVYSNVEAPQEYIDANLQYTSDVLLTIESLYLKLKENPEAFSTIGCIDDLGHYSWENYAKSGEVFEDLKSVIHALKLFRDAGYDQIYFDAG